MASDKGGIALLSMYNDEEEEEDEQEQQQEVVEAAEPSSGAFSGGDVTEEDANGTPPELLVEGATPPPLGPLPSPLISDEEAGYKTLRSPIARSPTPPPFSRSQNSSPFLLVSPPTMPRPSPPPLEAMDAYKARGTSLGIVDVGYGDDEGAVSPEPEEGEILGNGRVVQGTENRVVDVNMDDTTSPGTVQNLAQITQSEPPQTTDLPEQHRSESTMPMDLTGMETEVAQLEQVTGVSSEVRKDDSLSNFLPPSPPVESPEKLQELQERINRFLSYKQAGKSFNADLRNRKDYRNPDFLQHAVRYQDIDQIGSCFSKDVFDPHGYDKSDYFDEIEKEMRREMERKEQERKNSQKVEFIAGSTQTSNVLSTSKISTQNPVVASTVATMTGISSGSTAVDAVGKDRQGKKTKWDKIDPDVNNPTLSGGHDNMSASGVNAAYFSAANAGGGYTAFALQKRKDAEEKRLSDRR